MGNCFKSSTQDDISLLRGGQDSTEASDASSLDPPPPYNPREQRIPVFYPSPNVSRLATQLTEDEQIRIAKRIGLINHLPCTIYDGSKKTRECAICMVEFTVGEKVRYLPCLHTYHQECIDDWLMRSFTCPSCMEPVDSALLTLYETSDSLLVPF